MNLKKITKYMKIAEEYGTIDKLTDFLDKKGYKIEYYSGWKFFYFSDNAIRINSCLHGVKRSFVLYYAISILLTNSTYDENYFPFLDNGDLDYLTFMLMIKCGFTIERFKEFSLLKTKIENNKELSEFLERINND